MKYGWLPDTPDQRDLLYDYYSGQLPPEAVDLRSGMPPVYDQGQLGSCTANAIAAHLDFNRVKQGESPIGPSRLFIYYNERLAQGTVYADSGASIRGSVKAVKHYGACPEVKWPYDIAKYKQKPTARVYKQAVANEDLTYKRITRAESIMKKRLAEGYPFVAGFTVYESFEGPEAAKTGVIPLPRLNEAVVGGHAVCVVGYKPDYWICRNSWGPDWGDQGYFYLPTEYLLNPQLSADFWTLEQVK